MAARFEKKIRRRKATGETLFERIFNARGVSYPEGLNHSLAGMTPPHEMKGLEEAGALLAEAVSDGKSILIIGDFDADGATSSAMMVSALNAMGAAKVSFLVPDRFRFGYGLTPEIVEVAQACGPELIITVDNGISSLEGVASAKSLGMGVIVTDHHLPGSTLPDADAIVNPNQPGCTFPEKNLAGVGVAFYVLSSVRRHLKQAGWFDSRTEPSLATWLDLVALGTVADVVPLDHNNRRLVEEGLKRIRAGQAQPGLLAILDDAGVDHRFITSRDLAFSIAPRINAAGRLEDMTVGIACLLADGNDAHQLAAELGRLNEERKQIESGMRDQAIRFVESLDVDEIGGLCLFNSEWHQGVVGIIAGRLKEKSQRPVFAFARGDEGELKGSGRSVQGFHLRDALDLIATRHPGLLSRFGGHAMAAGLTLAENDFERFSRAFNELVGETLGEAPMIQVEVTDGELGQPVTLELARELERIAPWGQAFEEPAFDDDFEVLDQRIVGSRHLKLLLQPSEGEAVDAIAFNQNRLLESRHIHCAYRIEVNRFRGMERPQLIVSLIL